MSFLYALFDKRLMQFLSVVRYFLIVMSALLFLSSCGKKGDPTLTVYKKPPAPELTNVIHREESLILQWDFPKKKEAIIEGFYILKSSGSGFEKKPVVTSDKRTYRDTDFEVGRDYTFKIISRNVRGVNSEDSNVITILPMRTPPPPRNISYTIGTHSLILTWEKTDNNIFCNVYKSTQKGSYGLYPLNDTPLENNSFEDAFDMNRTVYYSMRCQTRSQFRDEGPASEEVVIEPSDFIPSQPKNAQYFVDKDTVFLSWEESDETWVTGYRIYRRMESQQFMLIGETQIPAFLDMGTPSLKRDYRITAVGPQSEGPFAEMKGIILRVEEE